MANVNMIIDEAVILGPNMSCIDDAITLGRGYGIRLQLYYQNPAQLKKCFPGDQDQTVLANCSQVYFAVNDSAEYISNRLGDQTIVVESWGESSGYSTQSSSGGSPANSTKSWNSNVNYSQMSRKLLKPEEILCLNGRIAITFVQGQRPILTILDRYYELRQRISKSQSGKILAASIMFILVGLFCLLASFKLSKESKRVRAQGVERRWERDLGRGETYGGTREDGVGKRALQR